jgi:4-amino-4-deoxy-L-arabinose transferase-like glycosyltransferase
VTPLTRLAALTAPTLAGGGPRRPARLAHLPGVAGQPASVGEGAAEQELDLGVGAAQLVAGPSGQGVVDGGIQAVRIIPALAGGAVVVIAARLAALFGAGRPGRVLAALATACAPVVIGAVHIGNTTPLDLLTWAAVLLCAATALLRDRPRWWLGGGVAAGAGLENNNLMLMLLAGLALGILVSQHRPVLRTTWPWLGAGIAAVIWAPNVIWQATHGWPQLAMASALHQQNSTAADYIGGLPAQLVYLGLLIAPLVIAGFIRLWRTPELRFIAVAVALIVVYVLAWVPGKVYYTDGMAPAVLAAGSVSAERWIGRGRRPRARTGVVVAAALVGMAIILPGILPVLPVSDVHGLPASSQLTTYDAPDRVQNDWTDIQIGVCTGPAASWRTLWPHLRHYG